MCKINIECFNNETKLVFKLVFIIINAVTIESVSLDISYILIFKLNKLNKDLMK